MDVFGFAEHQEKTTYDLSCKLTLTRKKDEAVFDRASGFADARVKVDHNHWYIRHYAPCIRQQGTLSERFSSKTPTMLRYNEKTVLTKKVKTQKLWNFELGSQESMNVPIWIIRRFQQRNRQALQNLNSGTFYRLLVTSAQCVFGQENILTPAFYWIMMMKNILMDKVKLKKFLEL